MATDNQDASLRQQGVLARFGELALRSDNLQEILQEACRLIREALNTDLAKVMELQPDGITLLVRAGIGWQPGVIGQATVKADVGSSEGHALRTGKPVISSDIDTEDRFTYAPFILQAGVKALVNVIILGPDGGGPYGILQVDSRTPRAFTDADAAFLRTYANLLAAAVTRLQAAASNETIASTLRESEGRLRMLIESMPQLVWRAVRTGEWTWASPQWVAYTGLSAEASLGMGWLRALHPDDRAGAVAAWEAAQASDMFHMDYRIHHFGANRYRWFQTRGMPIQDDTGKQREWIGTSTEIDDQVQARELLARSGEELEARVLDRTAELRHALLALQNEIQEREQAQEQLRQSEKLKAVGQLTGGIAHDFNNMLQALTLSLGMMHHRVRQRRFTDLEAYIDRADKATQRAAALTHRLLAFARQQTLTPESVDLDEIAKGVEDMIRRTVGRSIQVEMQLNDGTWQVMCDPNQLESALLNLCVNARDAMPNGGWLTITTEDAIFSEADLSGFEDARPGRYACIAVSDTGAGMSPEVRERVFEPFFTTKPLGEGTGLGLSQIYGFVRQSGGIVRIETELGHGTTVKICLPARTNKTDAGQDETFAGRTVLLVEDEPDIRELVGEQLREIGYRVLEASDGPAALRVLHSGVRIDMLVTDVGLPGGMNGRQVADAVQERYPGLPVILLTGYAAEALTTGMEVLRKPFEPTDLISIVQAKLAPPSDVTTLSDC